eukprot:GHVR01109184.1.p1 GENE.GHVR01109184.1~~GHVR01109184.1.p1  ORF type:complete len:273 (+),score=101.46 GHVR01109184.1:87-905(+)
MVTKVSERPLKCPKIETNKDINNETNKEINKEINPSDVVEQVIVELVDADGMPCGPQLDIPTTITRAQLQLLVNQLLGNNDEQLPYSFALTDNCAIEITDTLQAALMSLSDKISTERLLRLTYHPLSVFRVRPVTRCTGTLNGHSEAVVTCSFSPDSKCLASGSGDCTVRLWDLHTETPIHTCTGHKNWVLCVCWSPDALYVASGGMDKEVRVWCATTGASVCNPLKGHITPVTCMSWQPLHLADDIDNNDTHTHTHTHTHTQTQTRKIIKV